MLKTPVLGTVVARFALVRFCRMLGTLVGAGVPLVASLRDGARKRSATRRSPTP